MDQNCHVEPMYKQASPEEIRQAKTALLAIGGMGCENCATRVRNSLLSLPGVYAADVHLKVGLVEIRFDSNVVSTLALEDAVSRAGNDGRHEYRARLISG